MSANAQPKTVRATVWNEYRHELSNPKVAAIYPAGIHAAVAAFLRREPDIEAGTAWLDQPDNGLPDAILEQTDVLLWWGHRAHGEVADATVRRVHDHVLRGMGLVALHSAHLSKIFCALMGTACTLSWRVATDKERLWNVAPGHPITRGIGDYIEIPAEEMYGEPFAIPAPEELLFISWFSGGEVFRSGATWRRGRGRIFYFRPGHETYPSLHQSEVQTVIVNAVRWAAADPNSRLEGPEQCRKGAPLEPLPAV